jgi:cytosine/adenosine deaminase-related metal-dependent hydrolase
MQTHPQPERTEFVIRGANVVTMDPQLGEIAGGDVHVRDGAIVAVGRKLQAPDAQEIDGSYTICMPGFVDTHWHMWTSLFRGYAGSTPERGYLQLRNRYGHLVTPEEVYHCVRVSLAEALNAGITTVHNWTHNMNTPQHADETVHAHHSIPLRARYSYGAPHWLAADETMDLNEVARVQKDHFSGKGDSLLGMGVAMRGPEFDGSTPSVYRREWDAARALGLPITVHVAEYVDCDRWAAIDKLHADGLLGPDVQLVHVVHTTPREREIIASTGTHVSTSPPVEAMAGMGMPPLGDLLDAGILVSLSTDVTATNNAADMFSLMRTTRALERYRAHGQKSYLAQDLVNVRRAPGITHKKLVEMATIDGARELGFGDVSGSLTPGKRADLITVRIDELNMSAAEGIDPFMLLVNSAQPSNVDMVVTDGRIYKRHGKLISMDAREISLAAAGALNALVARV